MKPIAVFYHCLLEAPGLDTSHLFNLLADQMAALVDSGLADGATNIFVGVNGDETDRMAVGHIAPRKATIIAFPYGQSELPTLTFLQGWAQENPGWLIFYHHMKGARYVNNPVWDRWRACMTRAVIHGWKDCVNALENGFDAAGAHWLTQQKYPMLGKNQRYFGGNFWAATSDYLQTLPLLCEDSATMRYEAETFIGSGKRCPKVKDFAPHFPMKCP